MSTKSVRASIAILERKITESAADLSELLDYGYSEEQIYTEFTKYIPVTDLDAIGMNKKAFIRKLKAIITKFKLSLIPVTLASDVENNLRG